MPRHWRRLPGWRSASGSRRLLLQALLLDPVVNSITEAEKLLEDMLALQEDYFPVFNA
jgi:alpha-galactosidase/6-phospho-beta-glucosidase family protein